MEPILRFRKIKEKECVLFDEFFHEALEIAFIAFDFDGRGSALARCDGTLQAIDSEHAQRILFGVAKNRLDNFVRATYDGDFFTEDLTRQGGAPQFRLAELKHLEKYTLQNMAKKVHKELAGMAEEGFRYFTESCGAKGEPCVAAPQRSSLIHGNPESRVFHLPDCASFNPETCTKLFGTREDAIAAGFKPCKRCDPK